MCHRQLNTALMLFSSTVANAFNLRLNFQFALTLCPHAGSDKTPKQPMQPYHRTPHIPCRAVAYRNQTSQTTTTTTTTYILGQKQQQLECVCECVLSMHACSVARLKHFVFRSKLLASCRNTLAKSLINLAFNSIFREI